MTSVLAGQRLAVRSVAIDDPGDLLRWLPDPGSPGGPGPHTGGPLSWVHRGAGIVGWGEVARVELSAGTDRFTAGEKWLRELFDRARVTDEVGLPGTGAVAFGSFTFDASCEGSVLVVPKVVLGRDGHGKAWMTTIGDEPAAMPGVPGFRLRSLSPAPLCSPGTIRWHDGSQPAPLWERAVAAAVDRIVAGQLQKVVLARDLYATADIPIDQRVLLRRLAARYPDCYTFACAGLVGATPELLIRRRGLEVSSLVLAGTAPRGATPDEDAALATDLLRSAKNTEEHAYAAASVREVLEPLCDELTLPERPGLLRLANVHHLGTRVHGRLSATARERTALGLAGSLHPTAAVGGTPTETAIELIRELEHMDRDRWAGATGWVDADGNGEWGIALRSAHVTGNRARLFAGCGIVAGSDPATELAETQVKFRPMQAALES
jgi:menaquinone-specific isochorismate synthase